MELDPIRGLRLSLWLTETKGCFTFQLSKTTGVTVFDATALFAARDESEVVEVLLEAVVELGFRGSRYYDAVPCPIKNERLYILRSYCGRELEVELGYKIPHGMLSEIGDTLPEPAWDSADTADEDESTTWIQALQLENSAWLDFPVIVSGVLVGIICADLLDNEASDERKELLLGGVRSAVGFSQLKLSEIRHSRFQQYSETLYNISMPAESQTSTDSIASYLKEIGKCVDAEFIAYFSLDSVTGTLNKSAEVQYQEGEYRTLRKGSCSYSFGKYLTGCAWKDEALRLVPDMETVRQLRPELINDASDSFHEEHSRAPIQTAIYSIVKASSGELGVLRAFNRVSRHELSFTETQRSIFEQMAMQLSHCLSVLDGDTRLEAVWDAVEGALAELSTSQSKKSFDRVAESAQLLGFPVSVVVGRSPKVGITDVWTNNKDLDTALEEVSYDAFESFAEELSPTVKQVDLLEPQIADAFASLNITQVYLIPTNEIGASTDAASSTITIFATAINADGGMPTTGIQTPSKKMLSSLALLGRMFSTVSELARNRSIVYSAEEAISTISHEIKIPIRAIRSITSNMAKNSSRYLAQTAKHQEPAGQKTHTDAVSGEVTIKKLRGLHENRLHLDSQSKSVNFNVDHISKAVENALKYAQVSSDSIEVDMHSTSLHELVKEAQVALAADLAEKGFLNLEIKTSLRAAPEIICDRFLVYQLMLNLIDNAIKYSHRRGKSYASSVIVSSEVQDNLVDVKISNWGQAIWPQDYVNIFSGFYRTPNRDRIRSVRGVGLGLSTCKKIAELHRGEVTVVSVPTLDDPERSAAGEGYLTTFTVRLPRVQPVGRRNLSLARRTTDRHLSDGVKV